MTICGNVTLVMEHGQVSKVDQPQHFSQLFLPLNYQRGKVLWTIGKTTWWPSIAFQEVVVQEVVAILVEDLGFANASVVESSSVALKSPGWGHGKWPPWAANLVAIFRGNMVISTAWNVVLP